MPMVHFHHRLTRLGGWMYAMCWGRIVSTAQGESKVFAAPLFCDAQWRFVWPMLRTE
jgi:hypothetical protein